MKEAPPFAFAGTPAFAGSPAVLVPALTPFDARLDPDAGAFAAHCRDLLAAGARGVVVFGTTGEAMALAMNERAALLTALIDQGVPADALMVGAGACSFADSVRLLRRAAELNCHAALLLPPFFHKQATAKGLAAAYAEIIERVGDDNLRIYLYHIPPYTGVPVTPELVDILRARYPQIIAGIKDSGGDWNNTAGYLKAHPDLAVYSGSEEFLLRNLRAGGAGCIAATANINAAMMRELIDSRDDRQDAETRQARLDAIRHAFEKYPLIAALKAYLARARPAWDRLRPPLESLTAEARKRLFADLRAAGLAGED